MNFSDKKIAVLGLGVEGQDVVRFLLTKKTRIAIFDKKSVKELGGVYQEFKKEAVDFKVGRDYLKNGLGEYDIIFRSPGFKLSMPEIAVTKKAGTQISSATKLFFYLCPGKIIGVTGTKGKGTTATLIYEILKKAGKKVFLAGNIGQPMLSILDKLDKDSWVVLELSSFQLQDLEKSPQIAVVLFIVPEHLNYHKDVNEYIEAKSNIVSHQTKNDFAVLNKDNQNSASLRELTSAQVVYFSRQEKTKGGYISNEQIWFGNEIIGLVKDLKLRGVHNWDNVCAAVTAAHLVGVDNEAIKQAVFSFNGLEHRLEMVREIRGVSFYNDSFSTIPEATIAAIQSFKEPIILIAGGSEKGADFSKLGKEIARSSVKALFLIGAMAEEIQKAVQQAGYQGEIVFRPKGMKKIVNLAFEKAKSGDIVLLSPACASFDMFKDYRDRGQQFKKHAQAF